MVPKEQVWAGTQGRTDDGQKGPLLSGFKKPKQIKFTSPQASYSSQIFKSASSLPSVMFSHNKIFLLLLLSHFSRVRFYATP